MKAKLGLLTILIILVIIISGCTIPQATPQPQQGISYSVLGCSGDAFSLTEEDLAKPPYKMTAETVGDTIKLYKKQSHYCGADITIEMQKEGNVIKLIESNHNAIAKCMCLYDVNVTLTDLEGKYKIELWGVKQLAHETVPNKYEFVKLDEVSCDIENGLCCREGHYISGCKLGPCCCPKGALCD